MTTVPDTRRGKIEFYETHLAPWTMGAASIGLTPESVAALAALTAAARAAFDAAAAARQAAMAATQDFHNKVRAMHAGPGAGADMIAAIRNFAQATNNPNVYVLAQIPAPAKPRVTPPPPPGTPSQFRVGLLQNGALELTWKCNNPDGTVGTIYEIKRRIAPPAGGSPAGAFTFIGTTGVKSFTDETLPAGSGSQVTYQVTAVRSTSRGNPAQFTVNFGTGGTSGVGVGGATLAVEGGQVGGTGGAKLAA